MKEQIERKLGCSIDEYLKKRRDIGRRCMRMGVCAEMPTLASILSYEEICYVEDYIKARVA